MCVLAHTALDSVMARHARSVREAALGSSDNGGWSAAQYAEAALLLLNSSSSHNAVPKCDMQAALGRHTTYSTQRSVQQKAGAAALQALVQAGALYLRPVSRSISPPQSHLTHEYGSDLSSFSELVTARYAVELHCMDMMRDKLQSTLDHWQKRYVVIRQQLFIVCLQSVIIIQSLSAMYA
jgi:hypothetical protein